MNNFYELFTVEGDSDLFHVFRFNTRNESFDHLPSHLAKKLENTFDFIDSPSTTSATTYTLGMKVESAANTMRAQAFDRTGSIVLMEISA